VPLASSSTALIRSAIKAAGIEPIKWLSVCYALRQIRIGNEYTAECRSPAPLGPAASFSGVSACVVTCLVVSVAAALHRRSDALPYRDKVGLVSRIDFDEYRTPYGDCRSVRQLVAHDRRSSSSSAFSRATESSFVPDAGASIARFSVNCQHD
jgi:hypothetical protein